MANTPNKGGVSKKVENFRDRKLLRSILNEVNVGNDKSVIIRTAGVGKKPEEIKRDCEYLNRLWDNIKETSQTSKAPSFIHAEDDIIRRCIRDIYNENVSEVVVEGQESFDTVINFVKLTMPTAPNNIKLHDERVPIFNKYRIEQQISALYEKQIALPSGGSIVIDHTEALVAIDVNSGRATKESGVEETAYSTNLEAVREIARQLRLRDLAGLIVIDFIDMYDQKHRRNIERVLRDELQNDRARIQLGRISVFGLLEMSRQRLGASFFETITEPCKNCGGTGYVRSVEILAVSILRAIRHACADKQTGVIYIYANAETLAYIMNFKKNEIVSTEKNYNVHIFMHPSDESGSQGFAIKKRKSLSDEERKELEMQITTGKVNQMGFEKNYFENLDNDYHINNLPEEPKKNQNNTHQNHDKNRNHKHRHDKKFNKRNDNRFNNQNNESKKSLFSFLFKK
jgi:ribonuclease E